MEDIFRKVSIVIQGKVESITKNLCFKLRNTFSMSELILSTWEGANVSGLDFDKVVFSPDPGATVADPVAGTLNNVNRQIISTQAGLREATRPYVLKTRTDILFGDSDFLKWYGKFDGVPSAYFQNRLLICNYYTRNPRIMPLCFHPSDWIVFGRAEDVRQFYSNLPLMSAEDMEWFSRHEKGSSFFTNYISRYTPEQHIFINFLRQFERVPCDCFYAGDKSLVEQTERAFAECFVVLDYQKQINITFSKYDPNRYLEKHTLLSHKHWLGLYERYCKRKKGARWFGYLLYSAAMRLPSKARRAAVKMLDAVGLKEKAKRLLRQKYKHKNTGVEHD